MFSLIYDLITSPFRNWNQKRTFKQVEDMVFSKVHRELWIFWQVCCVCQVMGTACCMLCQCLCGDIQMTICSCARCYIPTCHSAAARQNCANAGRSSVSGRTRLFLMEDFSTVMRFQLLSSLCLVSHLCAKFVCLLISSVVVCSHSGLVMIGWSTVSEVHSITSFYDNALYKLTFYLLTYNFLFFIIVSK